MCEPCCKPDEHSGAHAEHSQFVAQDGLIIISSGKEEQARSETLYSTSHFMDGQIEAAVEASNSEAAQEAFVKEKNKPCTGDGAESVVEDGITPGCPATP